MSIQDDPTLAPPDSGSTDSGSTGTDPATTVSPSLASAADAAGALHQGISPKLSAAAIGGAIATLVGVAVGHIFPVVTTLELSAIVGAVGTLFSFIIGYYLPDPLRQAGSAATSAAIVATA
jgi:hypothetical protein